MRPSMDKLFQAYQSSRGKLCAVEGEYAHLPFQWSLLRTWALPRAGRATYTYLLWDFLIRETWTLLAPEQSMVSRTWPAQAPASLAGSSSPTSHH